MPYTLNKSNGSLLVTIPDQTFDTTSTGLTLVGRGAVQYGTAFAENFVFLMENFASSIAPTLPMIGQLWYDTSNNLMKYYVGSNVWTALASNGGLGSTLGLPQGTTLAGTVSGSIRVAGSTGFSLVNGTNNTTVCLSLSEGKIISVASAENIPNASLPATILLEGLTFVVQSRFPNGIKAGVTLATDSVGYVNAGLATSSLYADLAERYEADAPMQAGDVVSLGGSKEIFRTIEAEDIDVFGIVSTNPSLIMNASAGSDETHPAIALVGRVPCRVVGPVRKFQRIVSSGIPGVGKAAEGYYDPRAVIGRALENKTDMAVGLIEVTVGRS